MRIEKFSITVPGQQTGPAVLTLYQIANISVAPEKKRPLVIICGGGGYSRISDREREPIMLSFLLWAAAPASWSTAYLQTAFLWLCRS